MRLRYVLTMAVMLGVITACGPTAITLKSGIDTPDHHVENGMRLLESGKTEDAYREFIRAKELNPKFPPAYVGLGLVAGMQGEVEKGLDIIREAISLLQSQRAPNPQETPEPVDP